MPVSGKKRLVPYPNIDVQILEQQFSRKVFSREKFAIIY